MATFKVIASQTVYFYTNVEAENEAEAFDLAYEAEDLVWSDFEYGDDWQAIEAREIKK